MKKLAPTIIVAALLVATATAFAVTERLKLEDSPVLGTRIPALFSPKLAEARIGFRLRIVRVLKFRRVASLVPIAASSPESALPPKRALVFFIATAL